MDKCCPMGSSSKTIYANIDLKKVSSVGDVGLGDEVVIKIVGKVVGLRGPDESIWKTEKGKEEKSVYPGNIRVEVNDLEVEVKGEYDEMMKDDD